MALIPLVIAAYNAKKVKSMLLPPAAAAKIISLVINILMVIAASPAVNVKMARLIIMNAVMALVPIAVAARSNLHIQEPTVSLVINVAVALVQLATRVTVITLMRVSAKALLLMAFLTNINANKKPLALIAMATPIAPLVIKESLAALALFAKN